MMAAYTNPYTSIQIISQVFLSHSGGGAENEALESEGQTPIYLLEIPTVFWVNALSSCIFPRSQLQHLFKGQH